MKKTTFIIKALAFVLFFEITTFCLAQSVQTKYFKDRALEKEVEIGKAKFSKTIIIETNGTKTKEIKRLKDNEVIWREAYNGEEPFGIWKYESNGKIVSLDYEFELKYSQQDCDTNNALTKVNDYFEDNDSLEYKAPKISGYSTIYEYMIRNMEYPNRAKEEDIQGKVTVLFEISKTGSVENVIIYQGTNILLDKEAARIIRELKIVEPPMLKGEPQTFCIKVPLRFKLF